MAKRSTRLSRRDLLKGAAVAIAAPSIVPRSVLAGGDKPAPSERLTMGFIGVGIQSRGHLQYFFTQEDVQILAVCEVDKTRRDDARRRVEEHYGQDKSYKGCTAVVDYREITGRKDIDAVVIGTPDHWHAIPIIDACKAGKDIFCEKPLTLTIHEAKTVIEAVWKHDRVFQTGSQQRSTSNFCYVCELVRNGRIGKIKQVIVDVGGPSRPCDLPEEPREPGLDWDRWLGPAPLRPYNSILSPRGVHKHYPSWRDYCEYSGGMMTDWGAHHFDIAQWALGMDESGPVEIIPPEDPQRGRGLKFIYANGVEVIHGDSGGVKFIGTDGEILVNRNVTQSKPEHIVKEPITDKDLQLYRSPSHNRNWLDCIKTRKRPICDVEIGARSVTVCHLGNLAYWHGRKLRWDPAKWEFPGDDEANGWRDRERRDGYQLPAI